MSKASPHHHGPSEIWNRAQLRSAIRKSRLQLGRRLRVLREERGMTQEEAAELIGVHAKHLQRIERGTVNVTLATLVAVAVGYDVPLSALFGRESDAPLPTRGFNRSAAPKEE